MTLQEFLNTMTNTNIHIVVHYGDEKISEQSKAWLRGALNSAYFAKYDILNKNVVKFSLAAEGHYSSKSVPYIVIDVE